MPKKQPTLNFAPYQLHGDAIQAAHISALWFSDPPKLPAGVKLKPHVGRVSLGLGEFEVSAGYGDWLILTPESTPVLMSDRDFRMLFRPAAEQSPAGCHCSPSSAQQCPPPDSRLATPDLAPSPEATP